VCYVDSYRNWRCWFSPAQFRMDKYDSDRIHRVEEQDLDELVRYDAARFLERGNVLRSIYPDCEGEACLCRDDNGDILGYLFARPGRIRHFIGPFLADSEDVARDLLTCVCKSLDSKGVEEAFIDTPESRFLIHGAYDKSLFDQKVKPSDHILIREINPVRDFTRMYQVVDERKAADLVENFIRVEGVDPANERAIDFEETMNASVANCTESAAFLEYEARVLQKYYWGITGPEKG
ncbi:MAG: hypothetical protein U9N45_07825, partial [Gemmatimonadota bacterium]|nr:hypothetical protein [Gemmatimonadota bacterium]